MQTFENSSVLSAREQLNMPVRVLCKALIYLQVADALSTAWSLSTGHTVENNYLLNIATNHTNLELIWVVVLAKVIVIAFLALSLRRSKATWPSLISLTLLTAFYVAVVSSNVAIAIHFSQ